MCYLEGLIDKGVYSLNLRNEIKRLLKNPRPSVKDHVRMRLIDFYPDCFKQIDIQTDYY